MSDGMRDSANGLTPYLFGTHGKTGGRTTRAICASCDWSGDPSEVVKERTAGTPHRAGYLEDTCPECGGLVCISGRHTPTR